MKKLKHHPECKKKISRTKAVFWACHPDCDVLKAKRDRARK